MRQIPILPVLGGTTVLGTALYLTARPNPRPSPVQQRREASEAKRNEGLSGAGVGLNATTGGHELSAVTPRETPSSSAPSDVPREKLPSGGVGGGYGAGNNNARAIDLVAPGSRQSPGTSSLGPDISGTLGSVFGTGGATAGTGTDDETKDTRVASNYAHTPTKKHNLGHDQHQPRVPRENNSDGSGRKESSGPGALQRIQGMFGHGGPSAQDKPEQQSTEQHRNTKIASNHTETPTKRS